MKGVFTSYNFFNETVYNEILTDINQTLKEELNLFDNKGWGETVVEYSKPIKIRQLSINEKNYHSIRNTLHFTIIFKSCASIICIYIKNSSFNSSIQIIYMIYTILRE